MATSDAPVSIGRVALVVNDLDQMISFYDEIIGLTEISRDGETAVLGAGSVPLIELRTDKAAQRRPEEAGLFHTAFLLPHRSDLAHWLRHAMTRDVTLDGASDHLVSEALYLDDPEGNGIEIYRDRPRAEWDRNGDEVKMGTFPLDLQELTEAGQEQWSGAPVGTVIGHVHLQVGDVGSADDFMSNTLGLARTFRLPSASWYGSGGYHHHLAANVWNSQGARQRSPGTTGLAEVELLAASGTLPAGTVTDPWGTQFKVTATKLHVE